MWFSKRCLRPRQHEILIFLNAWLAWHSYVTLVQLGGGFGISFGLLEFIFNLLKSNFLVNFSLFPFKWKQKRKVIFNFCWFFWRILWIFFNFCWFVSFLVDFYQLLTIFIPHYSIFCSFFQSLSISTVFTRFFPNFHRYLSDFFHVEHALRYTLIWCHFHGQIRFYRAFIWSFRFSTHFSQNISFAFNIL